MNIGAYTSDTVASLPVTNWAVAGPMVKTLQLGIPRLLLSYICLSLAFGGTYSDGCIQESTPCCFPPGSTGAILVARCPEWNAKQKPKQLETDPKRVLVSGTQG